MGCNVSFKHAITAFYSSMFYNLQQGKQYNKTCYKESKAFITCEILHTTLSSKLN